MKRRNEGVDETEVAPPHETKTLEIAVCTYNNAGLLEACLASIEAQAPARDVGWSCLVVDNNCTDDTPRVIERFQARGRIPGFRHVREGRQGLAFARRRAILETQAAFVAFVDDDCELDSSWVTDVVDFVNLHPSTGALGGRVHLRWEHPPPDWIGEFQGGLAYQDLGDCELRLPTAGPGALRGAGLVVSRSALARSGWMEGPLLPDRQGAQLTTGGDAEMVRLIQRAGFDAWYSPSPRLQHFIPRRRTTLSYLCDLNLEIGRASVTLHFLGRPFGRVAVLRAVVYSLREMVELALRVLGTAGSSRARNTVLLAQARGKLSGALMLSRGLRATRE